MFSIIAFWLTLKYDRPFSPIHAGFMIIDIVVGILIYNLVELNCK